MQHQRMDWFIKNETFHATIFPLFTFLSVTCGAYRVTRNYIALQTYHTDTSHVAMDRQIFILPLFPTSGDLFLPLLIGSSFL